MFCAELKRDAAALSDTWKEAKLYQQIEQPQFFSANSEFVTCLLTSVNTFRLCKVDKNAPILLELVQTTKEIPDDSEELPDSVILYGVSTLKDLADNKKVVLYDPISCKKSRNTVQAISLDESRLLDLLQRKTGIRLSIWPKMVLISG
jgi:hypothetical protein